MTSQSNNSGLFSKLSMARKAPMSLWVQEALFTRKADAYFNPLIKAFAPSYGLSYQYQQARIVGIKKPHAKAVILTVQTPKSWTGFKPGQYVSCEFEINGIRRKRNYSICSSVTEFERTGQIELSIHHVEGGKVSNFVINELRLDALFHLSEAFGEFGIELQKSSSTKPILMLAAGSGITPIGAMLRSHQHASRETQVVYSCSNSAEHLFREEFLNLQNTQKNLHINFHTTQEQKSNKRVDAEMIQQLCPDVGERDIFICGSRSYSQSMIDCLKTLGVSASAIHTESFDNEVKFSSTLLEKNSSVTFSESKKSIQVKDDSSLLEQAELLGLNPKSGCRMGVCHSCTCTKKSGVVRNILTGETSEADEEEIRICISQAVGEVDIAI